MGSRLQTWAGGKFKRRPLMGSACVVVSVIGNRRGCCRFIGLAELKRVGLRRGLALHSHRFYSPVSPGRKYPSPSHMTSVSSSGG